ncbi:ABC transporter [Niabella ginsenosidivorans]|uniref:Transport permease protein n=1 Tax=Niabella ginsenosidivorans TaxID=1176587 RepID=A0A1A9I0R0_9BACT|nr:ABC transporter permease [Niabella ginsenosidivorans]ANH80144.1 ABC transporter [Niabella ginsenosidivorans]
MQYSQSRALWAITKASFKAIFSQPSSIFFSLLFPIVFILIFGAFGDRAPSPAKVAVDPSSDTTVAIFDSLKHSAFMKFVAYADTASRNADLRKGKLDAVMLIKKSADTMHPVQVLLQSTEASAGALQGLTHSIDYAALRMQLKEAHMNREYTISTAIIPGKKYRSIDFVLPGQLGFSVLFSTLFGIAFIFFNLREQLVLKRFYASPVKKINILIGIGASRLFFQLINLVVLILLGHFFLNFTLVHGALTFFEMLLLSVIMLFLLMGVGLIISSIAKNDTMIPLMINVFGFPQMLLAGTFFPIEVFPGWMQTLCELLPLTQFNDAMRKISFEGLHLYDCWREIGYLGIWIVVTYFIVSKTMRWE